MPILFSIVEKILSHLILQKVKNHELFSLSVSRGMLVRSHFLYENDILLFCKGTKSNIRAMVDIFKVYG